ncbi:MAG: DUF465 domain-containing protein [Alphaproteobacteria bacterium]|nr:DUF465 domain-containing protein [Alphaproteobacteria bacterium]
MLTIDQEEINRRLNELRTEHNDLDAAIIAMQGMAVVDQLQIQRLKKRKLQLKDEITRIEAFTLPDIIA